MNKNASVWDDEELYRNIRSEFGVEYIYYEGKLRIRSDAFRDINKKPSVDRAKLKEFNPFGAKLRDTNGIVSLIVRDVHSRKIVGHVVDVIYDPNPESDPENYAHSQIVVDPEFFGTNSRKERTFYKLRRSLARLATKRGWTLAPKAN